MRPVTLSIEGLRSYRHKATLDFSDLGLFAIVGDTGAGKSSILEAITYALYSAATWTLQPGDLIADGARTMKVELVFEVDGKRWRITRSTSRGAYPPPVHRLVCEDGGVPVDGRSEVNTAIERLVGLDYKAFLQSVILPQGRFADLLTSSETPRTRILQNIFRVDELVAARDAAGRVLNENVPRHEALATKRTFYLDDPDAAARYAADRRAKATARKDELVALRASIGLLHETARELDAEGAGFDELGKDLSDHTLVGAADELKSLADIDAALTATRQPLEEKREAAHDRERAANASLEQAADAGTGLTALARAETELEGLDRDLEVMARLIEQAITGTEELSGHRRRVTQCRDEADRAKRDAEAAKTKAGVAAKAAEDAAGVRDNARAALSDYSSKAEIHATVIRDHEHSQTELETCTDSAAARKADAEAASEKATEAERRLRDLERGEAAAAAAHDCRPGDACPVCTRELLPSWRPPAAPKSDKARAERDKGVATREKARAAADRADGLLTAALADEKRARAAVRNAERAAASALVTLVSAVDLSAEQLTAKRKKTKGDDTALLLAVETAASKAEAVVDEALKDADSLRDEAIRTDTEAASAAKEVTRLEKVLGLTREKLANDAKGLRRRAGLLPEIARPDVAREGALDLSVTAEERSVAVGRSRVDDVLVVVRGRLDTLRGMEEVATAARRLRERLDGN